MRTFKKTQPTVGAVHVDRPLTNISIAFMQSALGFVADQVFPNIPVEKQSDKYFTIPRGAFNRNQAKKRAPGTESAGVGYDVSTDSYYADVWAIHHDVPDQRRANTDDPLSPDREATELVSMQLMLRKEAEWMANFFATSIWSTERAGVASSPTGSQFLQWNDAASIPIEDIQAGKDAMLGSTGFEPNTLVLGQAVWSALRDHPDIVDRIKYGQTAPGPAMVTPNVVAQLFELDRIVIAKAIQNTAAEGATDAHSFIGGKHALLAYSAPSPGLMTPSAGYTFSWRGYVPGSGAQGQSISRLRMEHLRSDRVEGEMAFDQKVVSTELGHFFLGAAA